MRKGFRNRDQGKNEEMLRSLSPSDPIRSRGPTGGSGKGYKERRNHEACVGLEMKEKEHRK